MAKLAIAASDKIGDCCPRQNWRFLAADYQLVKKAGHDPQNVEKCR
jgi:hypothetical protein